MINIIAHRGFWLKVEQKNTMEAFRLALDNSFGIETDLRDFNGEIVVSHDIPNAECISFKMFMDVVKKYSHQTLSLNIKSDGLQELVNEDLDGYTDYFCFDMSVPDSIGYKKSKITFYTRFSDIESHPSLLNESSGVWLDNFASNGLNVKALNDFLQKGKKVMLVSPELHGYEHKPYWLELLNFLKINREKINMIGLCTDYPLDAREFFNEE